MTDATTEARKLVGKRRSRARYTLMTHDSYDEADTLTSIVDLVTDLLHLAAQVQPSDPTTGMGTGADYVCRVATSHYRAEREEARAR